MHVKFGSLPSPILLLLKRFKGGAQSGVQSSLQSYKDRIVRFDLFPITVLLQFKDLLLFNKIISGLIDFPIGDYISMKPQTRFALRN